MRKNLNQTRKDKSKIRVRRMGRTKSHTKYFKSGK